MASTSYDSFDLEDLRNRNKAQRVDPAEASDLVSKLNEEEKIKGRARKTFGRTQNGTSKLNDVRGILQDLANVYSLCGTRNA